MMDQFVAWFLPVYMGATAVNLLVDSGAQVTMMSKVIYDSLAASYRPPLTQCRHAINAANGGHIVTYGQATFSITVARSRFSVDIIVADMGGIPGVLGMDFLAKNEAIINCQSGQLQIAGRVISCHGHRPDEGGQVVVDESTLLPPGHVCYVPVKVRKWGCNSEICHVFEPIADVCNMEGILMPRGVIGKACHSLYMEIVNVGGSPRTLPPGMILGYLDPVDQVHEGREPSAEPVSACSVAVGRDEPLPDHLQTLVDNTVDLSEDQKGMVSRLLWDYRHCFEGGEFGLGQTSLVKHKINTGDHPPIKVPPRRLGWAQNRALSEEVDKMMAKGVIEPSDSPWSSPPVLVKKKDGSYRFCVDFRKVNSASRRDSFPLPRIDDCLDCLAHSQYFCTMDLSSGYWQIAMDEEDKCKTAFSTPRGHFQFKVMPFGVRNGPATLERLMELVLAGMSNYQCLCYMDDVVVSGPTFGDTLATLREVMMRFEAAGLRFKPSKCELFKPEVTFLGHVVGRLGVRPDPKKVEAVKTWPVPVNVHEVRSYVGFASYYRKFIPHFSEIAAPLNALTQKDMSFRWSSECQEAFESLKKALTSAPVLALPREGCQVILDTDASDRSLGGVLSQIIDGQEKVIAYASKSLNASQRKYCTTYKELLALVKMAKMFRPYLYGQPNIRVRTDHKALLWLQSFKDAEGMLARWMASLSEYDFIIEHREGRKHANADGCSRIPVRSCPWTECPDEGHHDKIVTAAVKAWNINHGFVWKNDNGALSRAGQSGSPVTQNATLPSEGQNLISEGIPSPKITQPAGPGEQLVTAVHQQCESNWMETLSDQDVRSAQSDDSDLQQVTAWLEKGERPSFDVITREGSQLKNLWAQFNCLELSNGKVVRKCKLPCGEEVAQLVIPPALRRQIFSYLHTCPLGGHMGINKTIAKLRRRFYWPGYREDLIRWCQWCEKCQKRKLGTQKRAPLQQKPVGMPLERVAVDIVGPLPETEAGHKYILVIVDYFTKYTEAYALPDQTSMRVADALVTNFILRFGVPLQLHSDQGPNFEAKLFGDVCSLLGICKTRTTPYRPQSDGLTERMNRSLQDMLAKLVQEDRSNWDDLLPYVMSAYRSTPHESTGITPNSMMLGRELDLPVDLVFGYECPDDRPCPIEYVEWVKDALTASHALARKELGKAAIRQARHYNRLSGDPVYAVGDWVLLFYLPLANKKLGLKFLGPYKVSRKVNEVSYEIVAHTTGKKKVVNVNHLKPYLSEILPDDLQQLPDLPSHLDLDGLHDDPAPGDPPTGVLVDLEDDQNTQDPVDPGHDELDLTDLFREQPQVLNPEAPAFFPRRSRQPPNRFGHNVGHL